MFNIKRLLYFLVFILMLMVAGCSKKDVFKHNYTYNGENEFWEAVFKAKGAVIFSEQDGKMDVESYSNNELTLTFKGELSELSSVKHIEISYDATTFGGKLSADYNDGPPTKKVFTLSSGGSSIPMEDEVINVTINLDGNIQSFELINK